MSAPTLLVASAIEEDLVTQMRERLAGWSVRYDPALVPAPRYPGDHTGEPPDLDAEAVATWKAWLAEADAMLDFDWWQPSRMASNCPRLRWIQGTNTGVAAYLDRAEVDLDVTVVTTAAGVHAAALAEFVVAGLLHQVRDLERLRADKEERRWVKHGVSTLAGRRAAVLGQGATGSAITVLLEALGVDVVGFDRALMTSLSEQSEDELGRQLGSFDIVVAALPSTPLTRDLLDASTLDRLRPGCLLVNVGRGDLLDEDALSRALRSGRLGGAVLDVTREEPLPADSPLWDAPRLVLSQHSAANTPGENRRIMQITVENAERWLAGRPLLNRYQPARHY